MRAFSLWISGMLGDVVIEGLRRGGIILGVELKVKSIISREGVNGEAVG